jgi:hypothetical protein
MYLLCFSGLGHDTDFPFDYSAKGVTLYELVVFDMFQRAEMCSRIWVLLHTKQCCEYVISVHPFVVHCVYLFFIEQQDSEPKFSALCRSAF